MYGQEVLADLREQLAYAAEVRQYLLSVHTVCYGESSYKNT